MDLYCKNFEEFRESLGDFSLGRVERITGVSRDLIEESARKYANLEDDRLNELLKPALDPLSGTRRKFALSGLKKSLVVPSQDILDKQFSDSLK